jgi:hypothetical protein
MRRVMQMAAHRAPPVMMSPDFVLRDFIQVRITLDCFHVRLLLCVVLKKK